MVGLVEFNMKTYSENWEFYTIEGKHIFPPMWVQYDRFRPRFDSGACIAKNPENFDNFATEKNEWYTFRVFFGILSSYYLT